MPIPRLTKISVLPRRPLSRDHRELPRRHRADNRKHDLAAVSMAAENQRHCELSRLYQAKRVMGEQDQRR